MNNSEDSVLVNKCLQGNLNAFETLIDKYQKPIFNVVFRMCHHTEDARDVTQSVFIKVYNKLASFNTELKFFSWLYRIAINETLNFISQKKPVEEFPVSYESKDSNPDESYEQLELAENIQSALLEVDPKYRALLVLKHFQNYSYSQIAQIMDLPEKTVKSRLFIARQHLGKILKQKGIF